jgi:hypothetical protein
MVDPVKHFNGLIIMADYGREWWRMVRMADEKIESLGKTRGRIPGLFPNLAYLHPAKIKYPRIFVCFTFNKHKNGVFWKNK